MPVIVRPTPLESFGILASGNAARDSSPYSIETILRRQNDEDFLFSQKIDVENRTSRLTKDGKMRGQYLGACLDYVRYGAMNACLWKMDGVKGLIDFIGKWISLNEDNLIWSDQPLPENFSLPHMKHASCPRCYGKVVDNSGDTTTDGAGRMRCARVYRKGDRSARFEGPCYETLSEPTSTVLPLEKILNRLNICPDYKKVYCPDGVCKDRHVKEDRGWSCGGHNEPNDYIGFPFCGWTLAWVAQKWYEQVPNGQAPVFTEGVSKDRYKAYPDFKIISSDDF